jgi:hypothetical protein
MQQYFDRVVAAATTDSQIRGRLLSVMNMINGPESLMHPQVIAGVVRHSLGFTSKPYALWSERASGGSGGRGAERQAVA